MLTSIKGHVLQIYGREPPPFKNPGSATWYRAFKCHNGIVLLIRELLFSLNMFHTASECLQNVMLTEWVILLSAHVTNMSFNWQAAARRLGGFSRIYPNLLSAMSQNAIQELERKDQKQILISVTGGVSCGMGTFIEALVGER